MIEIQYKGLSFLIWGDPKPTFDIEAKNLKMTAYFRYVFHGSQVRF